MPRRGICEKFIEWHPIELPVSYDEGLKEPCAENGLPMVDLVKCLFEIERSTARAMTGRLEDVQTFKSVWLAADCELRTILAHEPLGGWRRAVGGDKGEAASRQRNCGCEQSH
jgi:hypothetical protein